MIFIVFSNAPAFLPALYRRTQPKKHLRSGSALVEAGSQDVDRSCQAGIHVSSQRYKLLSPTFIYHFFGRGLGILDDMKSHIPSAMSTPYGLNLPTLESRTHQVPEGPKSGKHEEGMTWKDKHGPGTHKGTDYGGRPVRVVNWFCLRRMMQLHHVASYRK